MKTSIHISCMLIAASAFLCMGNSAHANVGATVPFTEYEAENGTLGGGASIVKLQLPLGNSANGEAVNEASGAAYVSLSHTGDSVSWVNNSGPSITALNFRINIPDAPNGGGISATLGLYINGTFRQNIYVSSQQVYTYNGVNNDKNPADGNPTRIWDEFPVFPISGAAIAPGSTIELIKDSSSTASFYNVDLVDLETPPAALSQPANSLSITSYGAVANNSAVDNTSAIQNCINAAQSQGKIVWIPQGKFYMGLNGTGGLNVPSGVTVQGAGMWYSTLYSNPSNPQSGGQMLGGVGCTLQDFAMDDNQTCAGGSSATGMSGSYWTVNRVWFRHTNLAIWGGGDHGVVANTRVNNTWSDGENMNNFSGNSTTGQYLTETNNFLRFTGDDALAVNGTDSSGHTPMNNILIANNTIVQTAGRIVVYGGSSVTISNNYCHDLVQNDGLQVGYHAQTAGITNILVINNYVQRCGNPSYGGVPGMLAGSDYSTPVDQNITFTGNTIDHPYFSGFGISIIKSVTFNNNLIISPGNDGILIASEAANGSATITGNTVQNVPSGYQPYVDNVGSSFSVTLSGNSWQSGGSANPTNGSTYHLICQKSGMALDNGGSTTDGAAATQWTVNSGNINQYWKFVNVGGAYPYHLICEQSGKALDNAGSTTAGTTVTQWADGGSGNINQNWSLEFIR
jgi:hypothetical protein